MTFFPLPGNIHLSLDYESPQNFLASPLEPKNTNHSSHTLSPTIKLHNCFFSSVFIVFVFVSLSLLCIILFSLWLLLSINDDEIAQLLLMESFLQVTLLYTYLNDCDDNEIFNHANPDFYYLTTLLSI